LLQQNGYYYGIAGLFSTTNDLMHFVRMLLSEGEHEGKKFFSKEILKQMTTNQIADIGDSNGLGWQSAHGTYGKRMEIDNICPESTFGQTGFTAPTG